MKLLFSLLLLFFSVLDASWYTSKEICPPREGYHIVKYNETFKHKSGFGSLNDYRNFSTVDKKLYSCSTKKKDIYFSYEEKINITLTNYNGLSNYKQYNLDQIQMDFKYEKDNCKDGEIYNEELGKCQLSCLEENQELNITSNSCQCKQGYVSSKENILDGADKFSGNVCLLDSDLDGISDAIDNNYADNNCEYGEIYNEELGKCQLSCLEENQELNIISNSCQCKQGYVSSNENILAGVGKFSGNVCILDSDLDGISDAIDNNYADNNCNLNPNDYKPKIDSYWWLYYNDVKTNEDCNKEVDGDMKVSSSFVVPKVLECPDKKFCFIKYSKPEPEQPPEQPPEPETEQPPESETEQQPESETEQPPESETEQLSNEDINDILSPDLDEMLKKNEEEEKKRLDEEKKRLDEEKKRLDEEKRKRLEEERLAANKERDKTSVWNGYQFKDNNISKNNKGEKNNKSEKSEKGEKSEKVLEDDSSEQVGELIDDTGIDINGLNDYMDFVDNLDENFRDMTDGVTSIGDDFEKAKDMLSGEQPTLHIENGNCKNEALKKFGVIISPYSSIVSLVTYLLFMISIFKMIFSYVSRGE